MISNKARQSEQISRLLDVYHSAENQRRRAKDRKLIVQLEGPIAETILFGYDYRDFISDIDFYLEQSIRERLWRFENIEDDIPVDLSIGLPFGWIAFSLYGIDISYDHKGVPRMVSKNPVTETKELSSLTPVDFQKSGQMPAAFKFYYDLIDAVDARLDVNFISYRHGPLDIAVALLGYEEFISAVYEDPEFLHALMDFITVQRNGWFKSRARFLGKKLESTDLADDWINLPYISPEIFREYLLPCYRKIEEHHGGITYIHTCGNATEVQGDIASIKSLKFMEISPWSDLARSLEQIPKTMPLHIRFHPNDILYSSAAEMETKIRSIIELCEDRPYIFRTTGLTPVFDDNQKFIDQMKRWTDIARRYL